MTMQSRHSALRKRRAWMRLGVVVGALFCIVMSSGPALAQVDLTQGQGYDPYSELITETIARRERNKDYYIKKQRGATTVDDQSRKFAAPDGIRVGPTFMFPSVSVLSTFDDNIFRTNAGKESDLRTVITPSLNITSDLPRHKFDFSLSGRIVTFMENSDQNHEDYNAVMRGALHFDHATTLSASLITGLGHEERGGQTAPFNAAEPVPVFHHRASAGITRDVGRLYGTLSGRVERWDYQDVDARNGTRLDQDFRDTDVIGARLLTGYRISPGFEVLGSVSGNRIENEGNAFGDIDGNHFDVRAGIAFEVSPLLNFELLAGHGFLDFDDPRFETLSTSTFGGQVEWLPTRRMTVRGKINRNISEVPDADGGSYINTQAGLNVDYEIYHNLIGRAGVRYDNNEFTSSNREDDIVSASVGLQYLYSKNMKFTAGYQHVHRESTDSNFDSDNNRFTVGAKLQF